jgi:hypothetical protein
VEHQCCQCHSIQPLDNFYKDRSRSTGHRSICKDCCAKNQASSRQTNKVHVRARDAKYRIKYAAKRPAIQKSWWSRNPGKNSAYVSKRRARMKLVFVKELVDVEVLYTRDKAICSLCWTHVKWEDASIDHIIPVTKGGEHSYRNTALAHLLCNTGKRNGVRTQQMRLF